MLGTPGYENTVPMICFQNGWSLAYGQTINNLNTNGNPYYIGADLRMGGCDSTTNTYMGYIDFLISNTGAVTLNGYQPDTSLHMTFTPLVANNTVTGPVAFTPINSNFNLLPNPAINKYKMPLVGINLSGMEFSSVINATTVTNLSETDQSSWMSDLGLTKDFLTAGINTVRLLISWGFLALGGGGTAPDYAINSDYWDNFVKPALETLTHAKVHTIIDLHTYLHYPQMGVNVSGCLDGYQCPDGTLDLNSQHYIDTWKNIYAAIKSDPNIDQAYLIFDLVNEPSANIDPAQGQIINPTDVYNAEIPAAKSLQDQGVQGYILIEGDFFTGLHSWTTKFGTDGFSNATIFTHERLQASGLDVSKIIINVHQYFDQDYSGTHSTCIDDLSTVDGQVVQGNGGYGYNLQAFADYLKSENLKGIVTEFGGANIDKGGLATCEPALQKFMAHLNANTVTLDNTTGGGYVGATMWGAGHGWGGNSGYVLYIGPTSYQFTDMMDGLTLASNGNVGAPNKTFLFEVRKTGRVKSVKLNLSLLKIGNKKIKVTLISPSGPTMPIMNKYVKDRIVLKDKIIGGFKGISAKGKWRLNIIGSSSVKIGVRNLSVVVK